MKKKRLLVVVDMQNDFISGALGTNEAQAIIPNITDKIKSWNGDIILTQDTHRGGRRYLKTAEGKKLPVKHCIKNTDGWRINKDILSYANPTTRQVTTFAKETFGSVAMANYIKKMDYKHIEFVGVCTDICVISNVLMVKAFLPEAEIIVDSSCCAGVTPLSHKNALEAMKMCHIDIINE